MILIISIDELQRNLRHNMCFKVNIGITREQNTTFELHKIYVYIKGRAPAHCDRKLVNIYIYLHNTLLITGKGR